MKKIEILLLMEEANKLFDNHKYDKAVSAFIKLLEYKPTYKWIYNYLGISYFELNNYEKANEYFKKAYNSDKNNKNYLNNLIKSFYPIENHIEDIIKYGKELIKISKDNIDNEFVLYALAVAFHYKGLYKETIKYMNFALNQNCEYDECYEYLAWAYLNINDFTNALKNFKISLNKNKTYMNYLGLANTYVALEDYKNAIKNFELIYCNDIKLDVELHNYGVSLLEYYKINHDKAILEKSIKIFKEIVLINKNYSNHLGFLIEAYFFNHNFSKSIELYKYIMKNNLIIHNQKSVILLTKYYIDKNNKSKAIDILKYGLNNSKYKNLIIKFSNENNILSKD